MLLAQVDPVVTSSAGAFAEKFGFPALLVIILLLVLWKVLSMHRDEREKLEMAQRTEREQRDARDEKREDARRAEREADRKAHIDALSAHTVVLTTLGAGMGRVEQKVDSLDRDFIDLKSRVRKFDPSKTDP